MALLKDAYVEHDLKLCVPRDLKEFELLRALSYSVSVVLLALLKERADEKEFILSVPIDLKELIEPLKDSSRLLLKALLALLKEVMVDTELTLPHPNDDNDPVGVGSSSESSRSSSSVAKMALFVCWLGSSIVVKTT